MIKSNLNYVSFREHMKIWGGECSFKVKYARNTNKKKRFKEIVIGFKSTQ